MEKKNELVRTSKVNGIIHSFIMYFYFQTLFKII